MFLFILLFFNIGLFIIFNLLTTTFGYAGYDLFKGFNDNNESINVTTTTPHDKNVATPVNFVGGKSNETKFKCPEEEHPVNIGPYEVPTQMDIVFLTKNLISKLFDAYYQESILLIKDIKEATKATASMERNCPEITRVEYRKCIKRVKGQSELAVNNLRAAMENRKIDVAALIEDKICDLTSMKTDPLDVIKILAQENVSLQFALPGFLRLINTCSVYCSKSHSKEHLRRNPDSITDLELVVKHFLLNRNINGS